MPKVPAEAKTKTGDAHKRVSSGIPGLDKLIGGGFLENDIYLVTGGTGTGKTLFCCQFLWDGLQKGETCIYFSLEELPEDIIHDAEVFGWDFQKYIDKKKFIIEYADPFEMADLSSQVREKIKQTGATRVVVDSTSIFGMVFEKESDLRKALYNLIKALKSTGTVVLMTSEILEDSKALSRFGVEEFVVDGVIVLSYLGVGEVSSRSLMVRKMRRTDHGTDSYMLGITKDGLSVKKEKGL
ncbi:MAG: KaiC domain-containing protein [Candidatus Aenigmarchaeota archaeon]|nr:KaiC domain-containing protein [Candidatus Aenigmarchaeota archaeon]